MSSVDQFRPSGAGGLTDGSFFFLCASRCAFFGTVNQELKPGTQVYMEIHIRCGVDDDVF